MKQSGFFVLLFLLAIAAEQNAVAQKFLPDTIWIDFNTDTFLNLENIAIESVIDTRDEDPRFVRYSTKKQFLLFPVDIEVYSKKPVAEVIQENLHTNIDSEHSITLSIKRFFVEERSGKMSKSLYLVADIEIFRHIGDSLVSAGYLFYDYKYIPRAKKESIQVSTENLLFNWSREFKVDLLTMNATSTSADKELTPNYIPDPGIHSQYINSRASAFAGLNWYGFQGEIYFTRPETNTIQNYQAGIIRYYNTNQYQSFALGRQAAHKMWRLSENWVFDADFNILLGFCKWHEVEVAKPTIFQLFELQVSSVQTINFNMLNQRGILLQAGLIENFSYIYDKKPWLNLGVFVGVGFKL